MGPDQPCYNLREPERHETDCHGGAMNEVPRRQFAAAYRHPKFLIVETWSGFRTAMYDPEGAQHLLPADSGAAELGAAVLDALARSRFFTIEEVRTNGFFNFDQRNRIYTAWVEKLQAA